MSREPITTGCRRVSEVPGELAATVSDSQQRPCAECREAVWVSPSTLRNYRPQEGDLLLCTHCIGAEMRRELEAGRSITIGEQSPEQIEEIRRRKQEWEDL